MTARLSVAFACLLLALAPAFAQQHDHDHGAQYATIDDGLRWQPADGRIEVVEVFAYTCGHCAAFQPLLEAWLRKAPKDVRFHYVPAAYDPGNSYARFYFATEALGAAKKTHRETFTAIHDSYALPARSASPGELAAFAQSLGVDAARLGTAMAGPQVDAKMAAAREFAVRNGIDATPTLVINGKYRVQGRTFADTLRIADELIARERAAR